MKHFKKILAMFLISLTLYSTVYYDYYSASRVEAFSFVYSAMEYMVLYFMGMSGYSPSSQEDLSAMTNSFKSFVRTASDLGVADSTKIALASAAADFLDMQSLGQKVIVDKDIHALKEMWDIFFNGQLGAYGQLASAYVEYEYNGTYSPAIFSSKFLGGASVYCGSESISDLFSSLDKLESGFLTYKNDDNLYILNLYRVASGETYLYVENSRVYEVFTSNGGKAVTPCIYIPYDDERGAFDLTKKYATSKWIYNQDIIGHVVAKNVALGTKAEMQFYADLKKNNPLVDLIYGTGVPASALELPEVITLGNPASVLKDVASILDDVDVPTSSKNEAVTSSVQDALAAQQDIENAIDTNTNVMSGILSSIKNYVSKIYNKIPGIEIFSLMSDTLVDIVNTVNDFNVEFYNYAASALADSLVISDVVSSIDSYVSSIETELIGFRTSIENYLESISSDTGYLSVIDGALIDVNDNIGSLSDTLSDALIDVNDNVATIPDILADVYEGIMDVPLTIDELPASITAEFADALAVDYATTTTAVADFSAVWENKFPFLGQIKTIFKDLSFSDTYTYPVIEVKTPAIIYQFYKHEYITLFDAYNYREHFEFARNFFRAALWIKFGFYVFKQFKVNLHVG